jgi:hypothetical protein
MAEALTSIGPELLRVALYGLPVLLLLWIARNTLL